MSGKFGVIGILDGWKKGDQPGNQMVNIILNDYFSLENGTILLSPQLASDEEVDFAVDHLIKDLESARKKAKAKLQNTNKKIRESLQGS